MGSPRMGLFRPARTARLAPVFQAEQTSRMSDKPAIRPNGAVGDALKAVARDILAEALAALDDPEKSDAVAVHDYRKAMKRWRALLRLVIPFLGDEGEQLRVDAREPALAHRGNPRGRRGDNAHRRDARQAARVGHDRESVGRHLAARSRR